MTDALSLSRAEHIRTLNDAFRTTFVGGVVVVSTGVDALDPELKKLVLKEVRVFHDFDADNDPHGEHDFGAFVICGQKYFWKMDYYARGAAASPDPADPSATTRVLTVMLAEEY